MAAAELSLEGVRAENSIGNRTVLDVLNAEQELLNSQVLLVTARRFRSQDANRSDARERIARYGLPHLARRTGQHNDGC